MKRCLPETLRAYAPTMASLQRRASGRSRFFAKLRSDCRIRCVCAAVGWKRAKIGKLSHLRDALAPGGKMRPFLARLWRSLEERQPADAPFPPADTPRGGRKPPFLCTGHARQWQFGAQLRSALGFGQFCKSAVGGRNGARAFLPVSRAFGSPALLRSALEIG